MLRGIGHGEADWRNPYPYADLAGLYCPDDDGTFTRGDAALILLSALDISEDPDGGLPYASDASGIIDLVGKVSACRLEELRIRVPDGQAAAYAEEVMALVVDPKAGGYADFTGFGIYAGSSGSEVRGLSYADDARIMRYLSGADGSLSEKDAATYAAAKAVHDSLVSPGMTEYQRVKAFHDWIVGNCEYDFDGSENRWSAYGVFIDKKAVCDGYAHAMNLLCWLDGIECVRVTGWAVDLHDPSNQGRHVWNKVRIDGAWYNLDACWDDPVGSAPRIDHVYFLKSDAAFGADHFWTPYPF